MLHYFNSPNLLPRLRMSGDTDPLPDMRLRHAQGQRYVHLHLHDLLQCYINLVTNEFLELSFKLVTGVERNIPPESQISQHKFPDGRSTVVFRWGVLALILDLEIV